MTTRILIAEDHQIMRKTLRRVLESHLDWQVCGEADNGVETVQKAIELKPDLIILDLAMPLMDGLHAAREITATYPNMTIVAHTIYAVPEITQVAESCGIRKVVAKGTPKNELFRAVERLLGTEASTPDGNN